MSHFDRDYFENEYGVDAVRFSSRAWWVARVYARVVERSLRRCRGTRFLEVGCGTGEVLRQLRRGVEAHGVDVSPYAIEQCRARVPRARCVVADAVDLTALYPRDAFDVVLAKYVLEHLLDPAAALRVWAGVIRRGGRLIFAVPNTRSPGRRWKGNDWFAYRDSTHVSLWSPERWMRTAEEAGFAPRWTAGDGLWDVPYRGGGMLRWIEAGVLVAPSALTVLTAAFWFPWRWSENLVVELERV